MKKIFLSISAIILCLSIKAQTYPNGLIDKTIAVVGNEAVTIGQLEQEIRYMRANGGMSEQNIRCNLLESMLQNKLFLMQARVDSLSVNEEMVRQQLDMRINQAIAALGSEEAVEKNFGKSLRSVREEWRKSLEEQGLIQQEQKKISDKVPELTPYDVKEYLDKTSPEDLPEIPTKYKLSQIVLYPDRESAKMAVKERLLSLRERVQKGEKFSTLARLYSEDYASARKGGELGMINKDMLWTPFSDAAMALKPGMISQIVETPDGFHLIEMIEKKGNMFNARHILLRPQYTAEDRTKAFEKLDSLRNEINVGSTSFELAAKFYSQDAKTKTNGGQMADINTGSSYFEIDQLKPDDYRAIKSLKEGEISEPIQSTDDDGRQNMNASYIDGKTCYKILKVDKIIPAHKATFEHDYSELLEEAKNKKIEEALDEFINEKIGTTYITIDPIFKNCPFNHKGFVKIVNEGK